jgi:hypothetical protein
MISGMTPKKKRNARQIQITYQSPSTYTTKKDEIKTVLTLINDLQFQELSGLYDELIIPKLPKTTMMC